MDTQDRRAIEGIFARLAEVERQSPPRDAEAEAFIRSEIARQPAAPYYMAQTIVMQSFALEQAQARIAELEEALASRPASAGGGLFGGLFGGGAREAVDAPAWDSAPRGAIRGGPGTGGPGASGQAGPWAAGRSGGGFLAGAAQTALGVAGGVLLGNAIAGLFQGDEAQAAEPASPADATADTTADATADDADVGRDGGGDQGGGFFDDFFGGDIDL